ncbi:hypothetical protein [Paenibacillus roseipurpureus]|uniref:Uncharacterized protein n=1 Tax=Paenibacillus roseopurpureus TaxID=2918901 RepID=A0AA96LSH3_9BACL|nr:hypothetical protein [Paenibacillus sp. MBLB1832]WNR46478.1 hypothetical protein MJB10_10415 [Paenibacillus sp. MBLB1832]
MGLWNLFKKEVKSIFPLYGVFALLVTVVHLIILYKRAVLDMDITMVFAILLPYLFIAAIAVGTGYYQLFIEWKTNSIYLLLSLPIRGWKVLTAKLAAVLSMLVLVCLWIGGSFAVILLRVKWDELVGNEDWAGQFPTLFSLLINSFWMCLLLITFLLVVLQFTFLCGQLVAKFKWLVMISAFLGISWLVLRISPLFSHLLVWTPEIVIGEKESDMAFLHSGPFIVLGLLIIGLVVLNGFIFEKEVEV